MSQLFGKGAVFAVGEIFEAEVLIDLEQGLVMTDAAQPWLGGLGGAEESQGTALDLVVCGGVPQLVVRGKAHAAFVKGEWGEVVGDELQGL